MVTDLYRLNSGDIPLARDTVKDAFRHDPVWNKLFHGRDRMEDRLTAFFETPLRFCLHYGQVVATSNQLEAVAGWLPGPLAFMNPWRMIRSGAIRPGSRIGLDVMMTMYSAFDQMERDRKAHMRGKASTYLQIIGVAPEHQGKGLGGRILRAIIDECEKNGHHLFLETETEENVALYERFGFKVLKKIILPVLGLPMWEMARAPRPLGLREP